MFNKVFIIAAIAIFIKTIYAFPDCNNPATAIEKEICGNAALRDLDRSLDIVYKQALSMYNNDPKIMAQQIDWIKRRNSISSEFLSSSIADSYADRILELFKHKELCYFFLNEFKRNHSKYDKPIACLAAISLWLSTLKDCYDYCNSIEDVIDSSFFIGLNDQKILFSLREHTGAYRESCNFFLLTFSEETVSLIPFHLPQPKTFNLYFDDDKNQNGLTGNFSVIQEKGGHFIHYKERPSSYEGGNSCVWRLDEKGIRIVEERQSSSKGHQKFKP